MDMYHGLIYEHRQMYRVIDPPPVKQNINPAAQIILFHWLGGRGVGDWGEGRGR